MDTELKINGLNQVFGVVDKEVTDIVIPDGVVSIKPNSFKGCKKLKTVNIPDSVRVIGSSAFMDCSSLKEIILPQNLVSIDANVFAGCTSLRKVTIQENVTSIALTAFVDCKRLEEFIVSPANSKYCSVDGIIYNKRRSILYMVPAKVKIPDFVIDKKVKKIEKGAFRGCQTIQSIVIPDGITRFNDYTFEDCKNLRKINIPEGTTEIPFFFLSGCSSLEEITLPESLKFILMKAFDGCSALRSITLPRNVSAIVGDFDGCDSLERIEVDPNNKNYVSVSGVLYSKDMRKIRCYPSAHPDETFTIPSTVTDLRIGLFTNCKHLKELHIPNYADLAENIIKKCPALTAIHIHIKDIKGAPIDKNAFHGVYTSLCTLYVPKGCAEDYRKHPAFAAFAHIQEEEQEETEINPMDMVEFSPDGKTLVGVKDVYKQYIISFDIPDGVSTIGKHAFEDCYSLAHISFPETLETIQVGAFRRCRSLKELSLPNSLQEIQNFAFAECGAVTSKFLPDGVRRLGYGIIEKVFVSEIFIPSSVKRIDPNAFRGCGQLAEIIVDQANPYFASLDGALYNKDMTELIIVPYNTNIKDFKIPDSVLSVYKDAFHKCAGIKSICLNDAIESFPVSIFSNDLGGLDCITVSAESKLYQVRDGVLFSKDGTELIKMPRKAQVQDYMIPDGVKKISDYAFNGCGKLQSVTIPESVTAIGKNIFDGCKGLTTMKLLCDLIDLDWHTFDEMDKKKCKVYVPEQSFRYGFKGTAIDNFDVYPLKELEAGVDPDSDVVVEVRVDENGYASKLGKKTKITGDFHLEDIKAISPRIYDYLDVSEASFGSQMEEWSQFLGMSHSGPVYGNSGTREVDILLRFISSVKVATLVLPDDVQRRHINAAKNNKYIRQLIVRDSCKLFSYVDGRLMNKKKTLTVFER